METRARAIINRKKKKYRLGRRVVHFSFQIKGKTAKSAPIVSRIRNVMARCVLLRYDF